MRLSWATMVVVEPGTNVRGLFADFSLGTPSKRESFFFLFYRNEGKKKKPVLQSRSLAYFATQSFNNADVSLLLLRTALSNEDCGYIKFLDVVLRVAILAISRSKALLWE